MKIFSMILIGVVAIFTISRIGSADRLYNWIDSEGVAHISKEPPPGDVGSVDIMEYSVRKNKPQGAAQDQSGAVPEKQKEQISPAKLEKTEEQPKPEVKPKIDLAKACYIQAGKQDVYVYVTEDRRPGGSSYQNVLWKGDIVKGHKVLIKSSRGKINYSYERSFDGRSYARNQVECVSGKVIRIR